MNHSMCVHRCFNLRQTTSHMTFIDYLNSNENETVLMFFTIPTSTFHVKLFNLFEQEIIRSRKIEINKNELFVYGTLPV
jgi:hypothetical protein